MTRCSATTRIGTHCRSMALAESEFCATHGERAAPTDRWCPMCRIRWRVKAPRESYNPSQMSRTDWRWLENAAQVFDLVSDGERFTAAEFVAWVRPDVLGYRYPMPGPETAGCSAFEKGSNNRATLHTRADPLPFLDRRTA